MESAYGWPPDAWRTMGFFELMARWRYLRTTAQREDSDARWHAFRQRSADMRMRSKGEH